mmetsp:Transcript_16048/g.21206  ORF Transcript_16048/g.21206 Transcript_16048/m.21206 type:complete len:98 (-) Transcript_16048:727-1020(-)
MMEKDIYMVLSSFISPITSHIALHFKVIFLSNWDEKDSFIAHSFLQAPNSPLTSPSNSSYFRLPTNFIVKNAPKIFQLKIIVLSLLIIIIATSLYLG